MLDEIPVDLGDECLACPGIVVTAQFAKRIGRSHDDQAFGTDRSLGQRFGRPCEEASLISLVRIALRERVSARIAGGEA